jgi:hypothetical protein
MRHVRHVEFTYETDDGYEYEVQAEVLPGSPALPPAYDHGGVPGDGPEVDMLQLRRAGAEDWVDVCDVFADDQIVEELIEKALDAACDAEAEDYLGGYRA